MMKNGEINVFFPKKEEKKIPGVSLRYACLLTIHERRRNLIDLFISYGFNTCGVFFLSH